MALFKGEKTPWVVLGLVAVAFIGVVQVTKSVHRPAPVSGRAAPQRPNEALLRASACRVAEKAVVARLAAPSTAAFPSCSAYEIRSTPDHTRFWVMGHVDSENRYGAKLRTQFGVELTKGEGDAPSSFSVADVVLE